jgi:hypothetical protein
MRIPKINVKMLAVALGALALAGGAAAVMAPAAAASTPPAAHGGPAATQSKVGFSRGFHIYNYSSQPITLQNITGSGNFEGRPADGSVLPPGSSQDIEVQVKFLDRQTDHADYVWPNGDFFDIEMDVDGAGTPSVGTCFVPAGGACTTDGTNVYVEDRSGTVKNLGPDQSQAQADVLKLCATGAASCTFTPTAEDHILSDDHVVGEAGINPKDYDMTMSIDASDEVGESDSVGVSLTAGYDNTVVATVTAEYHHEWTHSHTFSESFEVKIPPHSKVWFTHQAPTIRDTGTFTVTLGNTTWNLTGVYFDHPDLTPQAQLGAYTPREAPASQQELAYANAHPGSLLKLS